VKWRSLQESNPESGTRRLYESWTLPIPATYILDVDHNIRYSAADPDYTSRPEPAEILQFLAKIPR